MLFDVLNLPSIMVHVGALVGLLVAFRLILDLSEIRKVQQLNRKLLALAAKRARRSICVVIELKQSASKVIPLLDDIYAQDYPNLEVLVAIRPSAGRLAMAKLNQYRRDQKAKTLKLTRTRLHASLASTVIRRTTAPIIVTLPQEARLTNKFFDKVALDSLLANDRPVTLKTYKLADRSLATGIQAHLSVWPNVWNRFYASSMTGLQPGAIYSRQHLLRRPAKQAYRPMQSLRSSIWLAAQPWRGRRKLDNKATALSIARRLTILAAVLLGLLILLVTVETDRDRWLLVLALSASYLVAFWFAILGSSPYSRSDRVSLVLLSPFVLIVLVYKILADLLGQIRILFGRVRPIKARQ